MSNPGSLTEGSAGLKLPLLVGSDGTPYIAAAGDAVAMTGGWDSQRAPALVQFTKASACTRSSVAAQSSDVPVLYANEARRGATIYNDSTSSCYIGLGTTSVGANSFTVLMGPGDYYEVPFDFTGDIRGNWVSAVGNARVSEVS